MAVFPSGSHKCDSLILAAEIFFIVQKGNNIHLKCLCRKLKLINDNYMGNYG